MTITFDNIIEVNERVLTFSRDNGREVENYDIPFHYIAVSDKTDKNILVHILYTDITLSIKKGRWCRKNVINSLVDVIMRGNYKIRETKDLLKVYKKYFNKITPMSIFSNKLNILRKSILENKKIRTK